VQGVAGMSGSTGTAQAGGALNGDTGTVEGCHCLAVEGAKGAGLERPGRRAMLLRQPGLGVDTDIWLGCTCARRGRWTGDVLVSASEDERVAYDMEHVHAWRRRR
jgi:hypothetical protein